MTATTTETKSTIPADAIERLRKEKDKQETPEFVELAGRRWEIIRPQTRRKHH